MARASLSATGSSAGSEQGTGCESGTWPGQGPPRRTWRGKGPPPPGAPRAGRAPTAAECGPAPTGSTCSKSRKGRRAQLGIEGGHTKGCPPALRSTTQPPLGSGPRTLTSVQPSGSGGNPVLSAQCLPLLLCVSVAEALPQAGPSVWPGRFPPHLTPWEGSCFCKQQQQQGEPSPEEVQFSNTGQDEGSWQEVLGRRKGREGEKEEDKAALSHTLGRPPKEKAQCSV